MPMHRIYTTPGLYLPKEKQELAKAITKIYTSNGLPAFYVLVLFIDLPTDSFYVGGEQTSARGVARFNVQHLARQFPDKKTKLGFMKMYEDALKPFTVDKKLNWEVSIRSDRPRLDLTLMNILQRSISMKLTHLSGT